MGRGGRGGDAGGGYTIGAVMLEVIASELSRGEGKRGLPLRRNRRQRRRADRGESSEDGEGVEGTNEAARTLVAPTSSACAVASDRLKNALGIGAPAPPTVAAPTSAQSLGISEADYEEAMQLQLQHQERRQQAAAEARAKEQETKARAEAEAEAKKAEVARHKAEQEGKAKAKAAEARKVQAQVEEAQRQSEAQERLREQSQKQKAAEVEARQREAQARYEAEQKAEQKAREQARRKKVRREAEAAEEEQAMKDAAARQAQSKAAGADAAEASVVEWGPERQRALELALKQFPPDTEKRWDKIAASVGLPREACVARYKQIKSALARKRAAAEPAPPAAPATTPAAATPAAPPAASRAASPGATPTAPPPTASADGWSVDQQQAFDSAAEKYHEREWGRKRWEKIAGNVPDKSAQQCEDHARQLKSNPGLLRGRNSGCKPSAPGPSAPPPPPPPQEMDWQGLVAEAQHAEAAQQQEADVKLVRNHSASSYCCPGLLPVLVKLKKALTEANSETPGVVFFKKILPSRTKGDGSRRTVTELQLEIDEDQPEPRKSIRLCATKGTMKQEVRVTISETAADGEKATLVRLQDAIDEALGRTEQEGGALEPEPEPQRRPCPAHEQLTEEELRQRILLEAERDENLTAEKIDGRLGDRAKDANDRRAEELRAAKCAAHKEDHTRKVEREKAADRQKQVASAGRKLRPKKEFVASTSRTGCAGKLDRGALGTGAHAKDRPGQKALMRAHAEDAASRGRY